VSLVVGFAFGVGPLLSSSESTRYAMAAWTGPVSMGLIYIWATANAIAFFSSVACLVKRVGGVPWTVLVLSSLGVCYCIAYLSWLSR
jgi:hypothetical protein